jgi:hypothetical protein
LGIQQASIVKPANLRYFGRDVVGGIKLTGQQVDPWLADELGHSWEPPTKWDQLLQINHLGRHKGIGLKQALNEAFTDIELEHALWFTKAYRNWKENDALVDYTDLLTEYLEHGRPLPVDVLFVDEAQDLSKLQWDVVHKLGAGARRIYIAGDDDQAIFTWAGASSDLFINEPTDAQEVLAQSHRLPAQIHALAHRVISRVRVRLPKEYRAVDREGQVSHVGFLGEELIDDETFILFRNHHRGAQLARSLETAGVPFIGSSSVLSDPDVKLALRGYFKFMSGKPCSVAEAKGILKMSSARWLVDAASKNVKRKVTEIRWGEIFVREPRAEEWNVILHKLPQLRYLERIVQKSGFSAMLSPKTQLLSIHQSKGREAKTVILDLEMARKTYEGYMRNPDDEHRVFYVGITRAKERLLTLLPTDTLAYTL